MRVRSTGGGTQPYSQCDSLIELPLGTPMLSSINIHVNEFINLTVHHFFLVDLR